MGGVRQHQDEYDRRRASAYTNQRSQQSCQGVWVDEGGREEDQREAEDPEEQGIRCELSCQEGLRRRKLKGRAELSGEGCAGAGKEMWRAKEGHREGGVGL